MDKGYLAGYIKIIENNIFVGRIPDSMKIFYRYFYTHKPVL